VSDQEKLVFISEKLKQFLLRNSDKTIAEMEEFPKNLTQRVLRKGHKDQYEPHCIRFRELHREHGEFTEVRRV